MTIFDHAHPKKRFDQLSISRKLYQHAKNQLFPLLIIQVS